MIHERIDKDSVASVKVRVLLFELLPDNVHLCLHLSCRDARLQAGGHLKPVAAAAFRLLADDDRHPKLTLLIRECEARRHDADDSKTATVEVEHFAFDIASAETALPQAPTDHDNVPFAWGLFVLGEKASLNGFDAKHVKQGGLGIRAAEALRFAVAGQVEGWLGERGHRFEGSTQAFVILVVEVRCPILAHLKTPVIHPDTNQTLRDQRQVPVSRQGASDWVPGGNLAPDQFVYVIP